MQIEELRAIQEYEVETQVVAWIQVHWIVAVLIQERHRLFETALAGLNGEAILLFERAGEAFERKPPANRIPSGSDL